MGKEHNKFIETYKELEKILDISVRELEEKLDENTASKLRLCRLIRNYIQHEKDYDNFISISNGMQNFLESILYEEQIKKGQYKSYAISFAKFGIVTPNDTIFKVAEILKQKKRSATYVFDDKGNDIFVITKADISDAFADGVTKTTKISKLSLTKMHYINVLQDSPVDMDEIGSHDLAVVITKTGKRVGLFLPAVYN